MSRVITSPGIINKIEDAVSTREQTLTAEQKAQVFDNLDMGDSAKANVANNLTTNAEGSVWDARQGKELSDKIGDISTLETTEKGNVVGAVNEVVDQIGNLGKATLLKTSSNEIASTSQNITFDPTGYHSLMIVLHGGSNPTTSIWLCVHTLPINIYNIHTWNASLCWQSNAASGHCDVRYTFINSSTIGVSLDSKSSGVTPYVSVYGIK